MPISVIRPGVRTISTVAVTPRASIVSSDALSPSDIPSLVSYKYTQSAVSDEWAVAHDLNFQPNVTVFDSAGNMVEGTITHTNNNNLTIAFSAAISGYAVLS